MSRKAVALVAVFASLTIAPLLASPPSQEESVRRKALLQEIERSIASDTTPAAKSALLERTMLAEKDADMRRRLLNTAVALPAAEREALLIQILTDDADVGVRGQAATTLGKVGSERSLAAIARAAASDKTTQLMIGDIGGRSSARRPATFAIAELAARHPKIADDAAAKLRALRVKQDPNDNEGLGDARDQALYQITRDETLLKPFLDRLKSDVVRERESGVVAFQYFKLKDAPPALIATLTDADKGVRSWAALVLGGIGDAKAITPLMTAAENPKEDFNVRCNAILSLGRMKAAPAGPLMEKLLKDPDPHIPGGAAIALYRITGRKTAEFPAGYDAD